MVRLEKLEESKNVQVIANVMQESYEKRFNSLIHGIAEMTDSTWENPGQTTALVRTLMKEWLLIQEPESVAFVDCRRLPQRSVFREDVKKNTPIIAKLTNAVDKRLVFRLLKYLRRYNETGRPLNLDLVYISEHLPKQCQDERKTLLPMYKEAKKCSKKTYWIAENGHYSLYVDGIKLNDELSVYQLCAQHV